MKQVLLIAILFLSIQLNAQNSKATSMSNSETVSQFLAGFNDPTKIEASLALLAEDYQFTNPLVQLDSKAAFIELAKGISQVLTEVKLIRITENGPWVATYYEFKSAIPGLESNIASEWFRLENGQIKESHLIYDASEWRKVYAQMKN